MPLTDAEKSALLNAEIGKHAAKSTVEQAKRGWLFRIVPAAVILILVILYATQEVTNIPVYSLVGAGSEESSVAYSSSSLLMARVILGVIMAVICGFLWKLFTEQGGPGGFLVGSDEAASSSVVRTEDLLEQEARQRASIAEASIARLSSTNEGSAKTTTQASKPSPASSKKVAPGTYTNQLGSEGIMT